VAYVVVENSISAFADVARGYRRGVVLDTVAITGSVGKTTTKELCASIIKRHRNLYYTQGNFNSVIGMPMSLMEVGADRDAAVFEMGMSGFGEIESMTRCATPRVAMVTNIGSSHLEYLKTRENIARAKLEIAQGLRADGYLLLCGDEPLLRDESLLPKGDFCALYVGLDGENSSEITAHNIRITDGATLFDLSTPVRKYRDLCINLLGRAFVYNAAFAVAAAELLGATENDVRQGLCDYVPSGMRQNIEKRGDVTVIMDCYNAAPESMRCAIDTLRALSVEGKRIAVLGDMRELGENSDGLHREIGRYVAEKGIDTLLTLGSSGAMIAESAVRAGLDPNSVFSVTDESDAQSLARKLSEILRDGDAVLFKASRSMRMERVAEAVFSK